MRDARATVDRRTALQTLFASATAGLAGCPSSVDSVQSDPITHVGVTGTNLVVEFDGDGPIDQLSVVQPDGESFANRSVTAGSTREAIDIGTQYSPGEYTVHALDGENRVGERSLSIEPDVRIVDLKLGRNHPDEMYEGAGELATGANAILMVENSGTGPDAVTQLEFEGDVPQPTGSDADGSGIYDTASETGGDAEKVVLLPDETRTIYSTSRPFTAASSNVSCTPDGEQGQFTAIVGLEVGETRQNRYSVEYTGEELIDCNISVSEADR